MLQSYENVTLSHSHLPLLNTRLNICVVHSFNEMLYNKIPSTTIADMRQMTVYCLCNTKRHWVTDKEDSSVMM